MAQSIKETWQTAPHFELRQPRQATHLMILLLRPQETTLRMVLWGLLPPRNSGMNRRHIHRSSHHSMGLPDRYFPVSTTQSLLRLPRRCHRVLGRLKVFRRRVYQCSKPRVDIWSSQVSAACKPRAACSRKMRRCLQDPICMLQFKASTTLDRKAL